MLSSEMNGEPGSTSSTINSLLAILSQSTHQPSLLPPRPSQPRPPHHFPPNQIHLQHIEPVFLEGNIYDSTQWIGVYTTPWYEPRKWQLPRPDPTSEQRSRCLPSRVPEKRKRSPSPAPQSISPVVPKGKVTNYSMALKYVLRRSEESEFMDKVKRIKRRQDEREVDFWDERERLKRTFESKRKMNQLLQSLGSQFKDEKVMRSCCGVGGLMKGVGC
jgi:hypothetical protein